MMIEVQNLTRRYGKVSAVKNVTFKIAHHEVVGLLGHNGAGKSTIMKMLSGYLEPTAGSIHIDGHELANNARRVQRQLGYLPESSPVYPDMIVADYLDYGATLKGIAKVDRPIAIRAAIAATDLHERALDQISTLSRGLKQRVGVAQALLGKPSLLILDEPTNGLDPQQTASMRALIDALSKQATIILSTHIMQEVDAVCDRVLVLNHGKLVLDESLADLRCSNCFQLCTDDNISGLGALLRHLPQISTVSMVESVGQGRCQYTLDLHDTANIDLAANNIGQAVINSGAKLYSLQPLVPDLETIFREATSTGGVKDGQ
ncbi:MAG: ABC-2 type transport system ATP-binding protein [Halieaceae bacterium]|jgi:ABC-2 type transport system ATP-binding protein